MPDSSVSQSGYSVQEVRCATCERWFLPVIAAGPTAGVGMVCLDCTRKATASEPPAEDRTSIMERAIAEHRTAIGNAGTIKVQPGYEPVAEAKHRADERLWSVLDV